MPEGPPVGTLTLVSRLIVNADDLGYTTGVNQAIASLYRQAALSSSTAMASGDAFATVAIPPGLLTGCHVLLVDGNPVLSAAQLPTLAPSGRFRPSLGRFAADLLRKRIREVEIEAEAIAQIRRLQASGFAITHFDTHKHTHLFPAVLRPLLRAARACGIPAVRNPFEPPWARAATPGLLALRRVQITLLEGYRSSFLREVDRAGLRTTAGAVGVLATGVLDEAVLTRLLGALARHGAPGDTYELVCHPGIHDAALDAQPTRLRAERQHELTALAAVIPRWTGPEGPHRLATFADL